MTGCGVDEFLEDKDDLRARLVAAIDAAKPSSTSEIQGAGVYCFDTFRQFKKAAAEAGRKPPDGWHWHHIVNQLEPNKTRFGRRLHCTDNLIALQKEVHGKVTGFYNSKPKWTTGRLVREEIAFRPWQAQYEFGIDTLKKHGITP